MKQVLIRRGAPVVVDVPDPKLTDHSMLVQVRNSLISSGTEVAGLDAAPRSIMREALQHPSKVAKGLKMVREAGLKRTMALVNTEIDFAVPTGYSCAGIVIECGSGITGFKAGDRVACAGAGKANHAEVVSIPQNLAVHVPQGCDLESAASATLGAIAIQGIRRAEVRFGEFVAVVGLGLIGQLTIQLLKVAGCRAIGIDINSARVETARTLGAETALNSEIIDPAIGVMEFTRGAGADAVIITASSSSSSLIQQAMQMVRRKGRVVIVGSVPLELQRSPFYEKEADLLISCSYGPGRYDPEYEERGLDYPYGYVRWTENRNMSEYLRLVADGQVNFTSLIEKVWPLDQAAEAYKDLRENKRIAVLLSLPDSSPSRSGSRVDIHSAPTKVAGQVRVGIVGSGSFVRSVHLPNLKRMADQYRISAIASRTGSTAWNVARQYTARYASSDINDILNDPDIDLVMIGTRHDLHATQAMQAARRGKAVFLEKPAAMHSEELNDLLKTVRDTGTSLVVGFNRRFSPMILPPPSAP